MKIKSLLTAILTLVGLSAATGVGYALARLMPIPSSATVPNLPHSHLSTSPLKLKTGLPLRSNPIMPTPHAWFSRCALSAARGL
ncbi:MAG TPA: hypothetical protein VK249_25955 [Anaerolineales bacterium]|nr:hypothetical protein [Anaerolineales bacterium]